MKQAKVPLWAALKMKEKNLVKIECPFFLDKIYLEEVLKQEKLNETLFELPYYFYELYNVFLFKAPEALESIDEVKIICSDLLSLRTEKVNQIIKGIKEQKYFFKIKNLTAREVENIRKVVCEVLNLQCDLNMIRNNNDNHLYADKI